MKKLFVGLMVAVLLAFGISTGTVSPAVAGTPQFCHYSPDDGLDSAIQVIVRNAGNVFVEEGRCVTYYTSNDPVGLYVPANQEIWCKYSGTWHRAFSGGTSGRTFTLLSTFSDGSGCTKRVA